MEVIFVYVRSCQVWEDRCVYQIRLSVLQQGIKDPDEVEVRQQLIVAT